MNDVFSTGRNNWVFAKKIPGVAAGIDREAPPKQKPSHNNEFGVGVGALQGQWDTRRATNPRARMLRLALGTVGVGVVLGMARSKALHHQRRRAQQGSLTQPANLDLTATSSSVDTDEDLDGDEEDRRRQQEQELSLSLSNIPTITIDAPPGHSGTPLSARRNPRNFKRRGTFVHINYFMQEREKFAALVKMTNAISKQAHVRDVVANAVPIFIQLLQADRCSVWIIDTQVRQWWVCGLTLPGCPPFPHVVVVH